MASPFAQVLSIFDIDRQFWAKLIGSTDRQLNDWWEGRREIPSSVADVLSKATGIPSEILMSRGKNRVDPDQIVPPLWRKARESGLGDHGQRTIAAARLLASKYEEVLSLLEPTPPNPRGVLAQIKEQVDPERPARVQGAVAAHAFLSQSTLGKGATGIGEVLRGFLRSNGVLILETPVNNVALEGFCVPVGSESGTRPCIVANSYRTTWFRRNYVILHEFAHAVFDLEAVTAVFDVSPRQKNFTDIAEDRADAFAQHTLVPKRLLLAFANRGIKLHELSTDSMADLIAETHAEQSLIIRAAREYGLITDEVAERLRNLSVSRALRARSKHARGLADLRDDELVYPEIRKWGSRLTTFPLDGVRLPVPFVRLIVRAFSEEKITAGKAAELLMVAEEDLPRFGIPLARTEESFVS